MKALLRTLFSLAILLVFVSAAWAAQAGAEYKFRGLPDGSQPNGGLVADAAGNLYGTTSGGGLSECGFSSPFCGTVFKLAPDGTKSILHAFTGRSDGRAARGPDGTPRF